MQAAEDEEEPEGRGSSEEESSDDDKSWVEEVREQRRLLRQEDRDRRRQERKEADRNTVLLEKEQNGGEKTAAESEKPRKPQFYQIKPGEEFRSFNDIARKQKLQKYVLNSTSYWMESSVKSCIRYTAMQFQTYSYIYCCLFSCILCLRDICALPGLLWRTVWSWRSTLGPATWPTLQSAANS